MLSHVCTYELSASFPNPTFLTVSLFVNDVSAECLLHICPAHSSRDLRSAAVTSLLLILFSNLELIVFKTVLFCLGGITMFQIVSYFQMAGIKLGLLSPVLLFSTLESPS